MNLRDDMVANGGFWQDRNVFITGASGFLGGWLVEGLLERKANVVALVRDSVPNSYLYTSGLDKKIQIVRGRLEDAHLLRRAIGEYETETIFHLGAQTQVITANRSPMDTFRANIEGTWNLLEAARNSNSVKGVVVASTDKAYGSQKILPYDEKSPMNGAHPYDVSKSCADLLAQSYFHTYGLPISVTRCGNFYGGGDLNFARIVPGTIKSIIMGKTPVIRSDGKYIRDYFHIEDAVIAYLALAENIERKEIMGEAFNFSNEDPISVIDIVKMISDLMDFKEEPKILNAASGEIREQYLSAKKARALLDWKPKYPLKEGLKKTIAWYGDFFNHSEIAKFL
jgi:CDP-glucose 4,6-dehydratase